MSLVRTPLYTFAHSSIRDWLLTSAHNTTADSTTSLNKLKRSCYDPRWGHFLLSMRLFRSEELQSRLKSLEQMHAANVYLDLIRHMIKSAGLIFEKYSADGCTSAIAYALCLYLPVDVIGECGEVSAFCTSLMLSSEFLSMPSASVFRVLLKLGADLNAEVEYYDNAPFVCVLARLGFKHLLSMLVHEFAYEIQSDKVIIIQKISSLLIFNSIEIWSIRYFKGTFHK